MNPKEKTPRIFLLDTDPDTYDDLNSVVGTRVGGWWSVFNQLCQGQRCADWWQPVPMRRVLTRLRKNRGKPVDIIGLMGLGYAFSERAASVLSPLVGEVIELLPLQNDSPERFHVINLLDIVDCLDEERSKLARYSTGDIMAVDKYVFKPGSTDGHHLFLCLQFDLHPLVSAEFKALVEENRLIGAEFIPIAD